MSKLAELIQKYCPDGVEYHPIWSLTAWDKKFNGIDKFKQKKVIKYNYLLAADLKTYQVEGGSVKLLTTNVSNIFTTEELSDGLASDGEVVAIPWGGNPVVQYYKGRFLTADNRIATSLDTTLLNNKFLYYCMLSQMKLIASFYRGSGIKHPEMAKVLDLEIPVPPLPVQEEIVRVLDTFADLQIELQIELQKRKQQYNHYRDSLLSFDGRTDLDWKRLGEMVKIGDGLHGTPHYSPSTGYYFINGNNLQNGTIVFDSYTKQISEEEYERIKVDLDDNTLLMSINGTVGNIAFYRREHIALGKSAAYFTVNPDIISKVYLYYYLQSSQAHSYYEQVQTGSTIKNLGLKSLREMAIPVPPLPEQERIASILNRFDTITNDLTQGLPAEIAARKMQFEYYRDALLSFRRTNSLRGSCYE